MTEYDLKREFARNLLKNPTEPFKASLMVFPDDNALALRMANEWPIDKEVIAIKKELIAAEGELAFLPGPADQAYEIWQKMLKCYDNTEYVRLSTLYAKIMGHIKDQEKNSTTDIADAFSEIAKRLPI